MERKVVPVLLIIVLCVMVFSTYAWFSSETSQSAIQNIETGFPAQMAMSQNGVELPNNNQFTVESLGIDTYKGQAGFRLNDEGTQYVEYASNFADYRYILQANVGYKASSNSNAKFTLKLSRVVAHVQYYGTKTWSELAQGLGIVLDSNKEYKTGGINVRPTDSTIKVYYVNNADDTKIEYIVFLEEYAERFFEFDYFKPVTGNQTPVSAKGTGINLTHPTDVCESGVTNQVTIKLGFYGLGTVNVTPTNGEQEVYCRPFAFAGLEYQGTSFEFYFTAEVNNV